MSFIKFFSKFNVLLGTLSSFATIGTCFVPADKIPFEYKLAVIAIFLIINLAFSLYTTVNQLNLLSKNNTELQNKI